MRKKLISLLALALTFSTPQFAQQPAAAPKADIRAYIKQGWKTLSRSMNECGSMGDIKVDQKPLLYLPHGMAVPADVKAMQEKCKVQVAHLPRKIEKLGEIDMAAIKQHGLLYLPNRYVVPGGRFNEMYGWDSYFIILGLVADGENDLAKGMVENFFFQIEHYGALLNANRTYFLTRSQPPLLSSMIFSVYDARADKAWLERAYEYAVRDHAMWDREPHLAGATRLARYFDFGEGPVPETGDDPHYFAEVASAVMTGSGEGREYLDLSGKGGIGPLFQFQVCATQRTAKGEVPCGPKKSLRLAADYYKGDRSMRESGFDISFRFGPYSGSTHHYAPVCLNSLLYKYENDLARMAELLGKSEDVGKWKLRAQQRKEAMDHYMWNPRDGLYYDYDDRKERRSTYPFAAAFYPLWAGQATPEQARAVAKNLALFERAGGIATSNRETGMQWDMPYAWAPVQYFVVEGLRRYGLNEDADRIAQKFASAVEENFQRDGTIREKYNVLTRTTETAITGGYKANVVGFGWTNGVYLAFTNPQARAATAAK